MHLHLYFGFILYFMLTASNLYLYFNSNQFIYFQPVPFLIRLALQCIQIQENENTNEEKLYLLLM